MIPAAVRRHITVWAYLFADSIGRQHGDSLSIANFPAKGGGMVTIEFYENFGKYSLDAFYGLGQLYIKDERFTQNIDQYSEGLAKFMSEAMEIFSVSQKKKGGRNENNN